MTRYGIIGLGRVGSMLAARLTERGHEVRWSDPGLGGDAEGPGAAEQATLEQLHDSDVIVECVPEDRETKVAVLGQLQATDAAVLTTTSCFTVAELARESGLGSRLAGFHFLPSYGGELAEITTAASDPDVAARAAALAGELGLDLLEVADKPGRISRRLLVPFLQNALRAADLEIAAPDDIDKVVELGLGHAVGPLRRLADAGLDDHRIAADTLLSTTPAATAGPAEPKKGHR